VIGGKYMKLESFWTNTSVINFAGDRDPVKVVEDAARSLLFKFLESGGNGPPFNPIEIATSIGAETISSTEVRDARTVYRGGKFIIEFNPNRPKPRINYSIAHEIAHVLFPDCKDEVRHRYLHEEMKDDQWQLEMLCNIAAAEMLMPLESIPELTERSLTIEKLVDLRSKFEVSTEALLLRLVRTTARPLWVFGASRQESEKPSYKIDYCIPSDPSLIRIRSGTVIPKSSVVTDCTAIGFTARGNETWHQAFGQAKVECVGIPSFPGQVFPRVVGFLSTSSRPVIDIKSPNIVRGDATKPSGKGYPKIVAFVVNDATPNWGAGFALAVRKKWPQVQDEFVEWGEKGGRRLRLGDVHVSAEFDGLYFAKLICQHGYGISKRPRLRYGSLEDSLKKLASIAKERGASVHMPMIGSGEAGGNWSIILGLIEQHLSREGIDVTVYQLPNSRPASNPQQSLLFR
jgi:Zn-dependent peptidase ImmA (M78 family)